MSIIKFFNNRELYIYGFTLSVLFGTCPVPLRAFLQTDGQTQEVEVYERLS